MGVNEGNPQVMDVDLRMENFPMHTSDTYILTRSK